MGNQEVKARLYAMIAHSKQTYDDGTYFDNHLVKVNEVLRFFCITDDNILAAGWLHDTLEDTDVTIDRLAQHFYASVIDMVDACTDGEGRKRSERKVRSYKLIATTPNAVVVKLADRIANVTAGIGKPHMDMYRKEHPGFKEALYLSPSDMSVEPMWARLEELLK